MRPPTYGRPNDAGLDIFACGDHTLKPGRRYAIPTGFAIEIPKGFAGLVWDKGGPAFKYGIHCLAGVLDAGYRGELKIVLLNTSDKEYQIKLGDKLAQLLIQSVESVKIEEVDILSDTERGEGRFGSTGR